MKKNIYIFFIIFSALVIAACNDEFLDRIPEDVISDGSVWKTPEHLRLYVNNFYSRNDLLPRNDGSSWDASPFYKDASYGSDTQIALDYVGHLNGETVLPISAGGWEYGKWQPLRDINYFFAYYTNAEGDQAEINKYVGEAYFFRAIFYFNMVKRFGDVPFYEGLLTPDSEELFKARDSRNLVVERLIADLDKAIEYLPAKATATNQRVNKESAMLLQARIALFEGTWEKYHAAKNTPFKVDGSDGTTFLRKAATVTDQLIALVGDGLDNVGQENGYCNFFKTEDFAKSNEVFLWRKYSMADNLTHWWGRYSLSGANNGFSKSMIDSYLCIDGKPIQDNPNYKGDETLLDVVTNRDPRLIQSLYVNDGEHVRLDNGDIFKWPMGDCSTGYQIYKGHNPDADQYEQKKCITGQIYFRFGEALLINAEAKAELGEFNQTVADNTINKLRDRVGMTHMKLSEIGNFPKEFPDLSSEINEIRRERKVELAAEGFRRDDIFRWAAADILIKGYIPLGAKKAQWEGTEAPQTLLAKPVNRDGYIMPYANQAAANGYNFNLERDYLWPLPTTEILLNPNLKQNPGWEQ